MPLCRPRVSCFEQVAGKRIRRRDRDLGRVLEQVEADAQLAREGGCGVPVSCLVERECAGDVWHLLFRPDDRSYEPAFVYPRHGSVRGGGRRADAGCPDERGARGPRAVLAAAAPASSTSTADAGRCRAADGRGRV